MSSGLLCFPFYWIFYSIGAGSFYLAISVFCFCFFFFLENLRDDR